MNFQSIDNYTNTKILVNPKVVPTYFFMHHVSSNHSKTKEVPLQTNDHYEKFNRRCALATFNELKEMM